MLIRHRLFSLVLLLYVIINLLYNTASPIFEPPDEATHYRYIKYLLDHKSLPTLIDGPDRQELWGLHQPPLYFLISAVLASPFEHIAPTDYLDKNPHVNLGFATRPGNKNFFVHPADDIFPYAGFSRLIHGLRLVSLFYGAITLTFVYLTGLRIFEGRKTTALVAPVFMTLHPEFVFINAEIANEPLNIMLMSAGLWGCIRLIMDGPSRRLAVFLGCTAGLIAIAKMTGLALFLLIVVAMLIAALRKYPALKLWEFGLIVGGLAAVLGGWWYLRNWWVYGDPWQAMMYQEFYDAPQRSITLQQWYWGILAGEVSFWATFGWLNILAPEWVYTFYKVLLRVGLLGLVIYGIRLLLNQGRILSAHQALGKYNVQSTLLPAKVVLIIFLLTSPFISSLILSRLLATETGIQGRQLLPLLPALSLLLTIGYRALIPRSLFRLTMMGLGLVMLGITLYLPYFVIKPAYAAPPYFTETTLPADMVRLARRYDDQLELLGYRVETDTVFPGQIDKLTLYWRPLQPIEQNYTVFIHALGRGLVKVGEYNGYPGMGNLSTTLWPTGQITEDAYAFQIDPQAQGPSLLRLHVGLFDHTRLDLPPLSIRDQAGNLISPLVTQQVLAPPVETTTTQNPDCIRLAVHFADHLKLSCYGLVIKDTEAVLTLHWVVDQKPSEDYTVFIQLWQRNQQIAGFDAPPFEGDFPTSYWRANQPLADEHTLDTRELSPGTYRLFVGLYNAKTGGRLSASDSQGVLLQDFAVDLGELVIVE